MSLQESIADVQPAWDAFVKRAQSAAKPPSADDMRDLKILYHDVQRAMLSIGTDLNWHHPLT